MKKILITGGTGLVGSRLTALLLGKGYEVRHLSRRENPTADVPTYRWDVGAKYIDPKALEGVDAIIHLAGAGIADARWTKKRKATIMSSRVDSTALLYKYLSEKSNQVKTFVAASAIGFYGDSGDEMVDENSAASDCFLGRVSQAWEAQSLKMVDLDKRTTVLRIGIVLAEEGGALPKMAMPIRFGVNSYFGDGQQLYSWIHIDDLCQMFVFALENEAIDGIYNAVTDVATNKDLVQKLAKAMDKKALLVPTPAAVLRLGMGEMSAIVLNSNRTSSAKIRTAGFAFRYEGLEEALGEIFFG